MIFNNCPTCGGRQVVVCEYCDGEGQFLCCGYMAKCEECDNEGELPCPTCQDSDGNPTGRGLFLSLDEIDDLKTAVEFMAEKNPDWNAEVDIFQAELTHRAKAQTPDRKEGGGE